jgi:hypothetical protein
MNLSKNKVVKISKHQASKKNHEHMKGETAKPEKTVMSNHDWVVKNRANKMGVSIEVYKERFCKKG